MLPPPAPVHIPSVCNALLPTVSVLPVSGFQPKVRHLADAIRSFRVSAVASSVPALLICKR